MWGLVVTNRVLELVEYFLCFAIELQWQRPGQHGDVLVCLSNGQTEGATPVCLCNRGVSCFYLVPLNERYTSK